jgi:hypothetical protein
MLIAYTECLVDKDNLWLVYAKISFNGGGKSLILK